MCFEKHCEFYNWLDNDLVKLEKRIEQLEKNTQIKLFINDKEIAQIIVDELKNGNTKLINSIRRVLK